MAVTAIKTLLLFLLALLTFRSSTPSVIASGRSNHCCTYGSMVVFGDSLADAGNLAELARGDAQKCPSLSSQYGITFFHHPNGRFSDGRLVVDFLAQEIRLPLLPPYLSGGDYSHGANFAVAGATALDREYYKQLGIQINWCNNSLSVQLDWFQQMIDDNQVNCPRREQGNEKKCDFSETLFVVGEFGGNDYYHPLTGGEAINVTTERVPLVIDAIRSAIEFVIERGAKTVLAPGNIPMGCQPAMLTYFHSNSSTEDYNPRTGCLDWLNEFSEYHNLLLKEELNRLRVRHTNVTIVYVDLYNAAMSIYNSPRRFGFKKTTRACCGSGGGAYNFDSTKRCGSYASRVCDDPSSHVSWDGVHMTEAAYQIITASLLQGLHTFPEILQNLPCGRAAVTKQ